MATEFNKRGNTRENSVNGIKFDFLINLTKEINKETTNYDKKNKEVLKIEKEINFLINKKDEESIIKLKKLEGDKNKINSELEDINNSFKSGEKTKEILDKLSEVVSEVPAEKVRGILIEVDKARPRVDLETYTQKLLENSFTLIRTKEGALKNKNPFSSKMVDDEIKSDILIG